MKANREYELIVRKGGRAPGLLASPDRADHVEVVEIATGEVALFWDTAPAQTGRLARAARRPRAARRGRLPRQVAPLAERLGPSEQAHTGNGRGRTYGPPTRP
jgi:hypothetical protein